MPGSTQQLRVMGGAEAEAAIRVETAVEGSGRRRRGDSQVRGRGYRWSV